MSVYFDELKRTFEEFYPTYKSWVKENEDKFPPDKIGSSAFTMQEASELLLEFSDTINIVLQNKEQCIKYVNEEELKDIQTELNNMMTVANNSVSTDNYKSFVSKVDELIWHVRPFQYISMEKMDEKRYREISDMDEVLSDIRKKQISFINADKKIQEGNQNLLNLIEVVHEKNKKLETLVNENNQTVEDLSTTLENANDYVNQIKDILNNANEQKQVVDEFVTAIKNREEKIDSQNAATKVYEEKLTAFSADQQTKLKEFADKYQASMEEAEDLIKKSSNALNLSTAYELSEAFQARREKLEDKNVKKSWLWGGGIAVVGAIGIGIIIIFFGKDTTIANVIARTFIMMILIAVAVFCSKQYAKNRSYEEDYAYKAALVASYPGLATEFEKAESRKEYVVKLLDEILQDPQRVRHDKESLEDGFSLFMKWKKFFKKVKTETSEETDKPQPK